MKSHEASEARGPLTGARSWIAFGTFLATLAVALVPDLEDSRGAEVAWTASDPERPRIRAANVPSDSPATGRTMPEHRPPGPPTERRIDPTPPPARSAAATGRPVFDPPAGALEDPQLLRDWLLALSDGELAAAVSSADLDRCVSRVVSHLIEAGEDGPPAVAEFLERLNGRIDSVRRGRR